MTKSQVISAMIAAEFAKTGDIKVAFDAIMGAGAYDKLAGELYDKIKAA